MSNKINRFAFLLFTIIFLSSCATAPEPDKDFVAGPVASVGDSFVQVGAFAVSTNATNMVARLQAMGYNADLIPGNIGRRSIQLVRIHNLSGADAYSICNILKSRGIECFSNIDTNSFTGNFAVSPRAVPIVGVVTETILPPVADNASPVSPKYLVGDPYYIPRVVTEVY